MKNPDIHEDTKSFFRHCKATFWNNRDWLGKLIFLPMWIVILIGVLVFWFLETLLSGTEKK